jgi:serine O-acetyltransferase
VTNPKTLTNDREFALVSFLAADLLRVQIILHGTKIHPSGLRFWLGLFSPRFMPVLLCRIAHWFYRLGISPLAKLTSLLNFFFFGIEIAIRCPIGRGLFLPHTQGTVIGAWAIGENVTIFQGVTLGAKEVDFSYLSTSRPVIMDDVIIGSGAKVLGGLIVGKGSRIGANAVVLSSVPQGVVAAGVPAIVVKALP